jgi:catechol 2,3-dioxygenase-like lactoylglutathione lyase family enzyme
MQITKSVKPEKPLIDIELISHGTLTSLDLQVSRRFYEEVLGFEIIQHSTATMLARKGTAHTYVIVETGQPSTMSMLDHNGLDVESREAVDEAYETLMRVKDEYGIKRIKKPVDQHGAYAFYFADPDGNWWEILSGFGGGYDVLFDYPQYDLTGRDDVDTEIMYCSVDREDYDRFRAEYPKRRESQGRS